MFNTTSNHDINNENINKIISETADNIIKELSGGPVKHKQKVIDNLVVFMSCAGGAGASTIVSNLAYTMQRKKLTVLVIDLNISYPIQHNYFNIKQTLDKKDLVSFLLGKNAIGESLELKRDISVLLANNRNIMDSINCDTEMCSRNLEEAIDRIRPLFDIIIVDCPMNLQLDIVNCILHKADSIYSVWDENIACISNMERLRRNMMLSGIEAYNKVRVVFNKRTSIHYSKYPFEKLGLSVVSTFPFELSIIESGIRGEIFCEKGASISRNAAYYVAEMGRLADKVLEIGGYEV